MSRRTLIVLLVSVLALAVLWRGVNGPAGGEASKGGGVPLVPALSTAEAVRSIELSQDGEKVTLTREGPLWVTDEASAGGFAVESGRVQALLRAVARLNTDQPRTANPARHAALGLAWSESEPSAQRLTLRAGDEVLADLLVGFNQADSMTNELVFVRRMGEDQTYRAEHDVPFEVFGVEWVSSEAVWIDPQEVEWVSYDGLKVSRPAAAQEEPVPSAEAVAGEDGLDGGIDGDAPSDAPEWETQVVDADRSARWTEDEIGQALGTLPTWMDGLGLDKIVPWDPSGVAEGREQITYGLIDGSTVECMLFTDAQGTWHVRQLAQPEPAAAGPDSADDASAAVRARARRGAYAIQVPAFQISGVQELFEEPQAAADETPIDGTEVDEAQVVGEAGVETQEVPGPE